jgi:protein-L-isoaspartate(D-aspartate) O-methyltransferase
VSVERYRTLADLARGRLTALAYNNVEVVAGDGLAGVPSRAPFERIIVTAATEDVPPALTEQLGEGGIMVLPLGPHAGPQHLVKITKSPGGAIEHEKLIAVRFVPLLPGQAQEL